MKIMDKYGNTVECCENVEKFKRESTFLSYLEEVYLLVNFCGFNKNQAEIETLKKYPDLA